MPANPGHLAQRGEPVRNPLVDAKIPGRFHVALVCLLGIGGVLGLLFGLFLLSDISGIQERRELVARLPGFKDAAPGEAAVLEGHVADHTPVLRKGFVAYELRQHQRQRRSNVLVGGEIQPLDVVTPLGTVRILRADYAFDQVHEGWAAEEREDSGPTFTTSAITIRGFLPGSPIMALGVRGSGEAAGGFLAEVVTAKNRTEYLDELIGLESRSRTLGLILLGICALMVVAAVIGVRRILRAPAGAGQGTADSHDCFGGVDGAGDS
jgi:hypothetical protein